ncbi:unnamed protein product [Thelazia callipaeda]|uniref:Transmembrane protein n=1 Tax=Thelazia callipaeda TaxID=103827 RepID=A0A0N5CN73_THECL|nr:unnamed protein product [Thelazia callipaeda]
MGHLKVPSHPEVFRQNMRVMVFMLYVFGNLSWGSCLAYCSSRVLVLRLIGDPPMLEGITETGKCTPWDV